MSHRGFSTTTKRLIQLVGKVSLSDVTRINGADGPKWVTNVETVAAALESDVSITLWPPLSMSIC